MRILTKNERKNQNVLLLCLIALLTLGMSLFLGGCNKSNYEKEINISISNNVATIENEKSFQNEINTIIKNNNCQFNDNSQIALQGELIRVEDVYNAFITINVNNSEDKENQIIDQNELKAIKEILEAFRKKYFEGKYEEYAFSYYFNKCTMENTPYFDTFVQFYENCSGVVKVAIEDNSILAEFDSNIIAQLEKDGEIVWETPAMHEVKIESFRDSYMLSFSGIDANSDTINEFLKGCPSEISLLQVNVPDEENNSVFNFSKPINHFVFCPSSSGQKKYSVTINGAINKCEFGSHLVGVDDITFENLSPEDIHTWEFIEEENKLTYKHLINGKEEENKTVEAEEN